MREILFRGKRTDTGAWVKGLLARYNPNFEAANIVGLAECLIPVHTSTVGQFTGLTDKNGNRIFEGDIIRDDWGKIYEVFFTTDSCSFMVLCTSAPNECETGRYRLGKKWCNTIEVIGNIHDNPELLKGE